MKPGGGEHPLTVAVRMRPMADYEILSGGTQVAHTVDNQMVVLLDPTEDPDDILRANRSRERRYVFDFAFDDTADQEEVYQATTRFLIDQVMTGYNGTVFAYGATGAGKTYTMLGTPTQPGIYWRALNDLFRLVESNKEDNLYEVSMSYLEIYNEMIRDLLNPNSGYLEMREDAKGGVQVAGLSEMSTTSTEEIMELLQRGNMERTQEPTKANKTSSRSHAVLQITVKQRVRARGATSQVKTGRLFLVDLAGSERAANTQNRGKRMVEGAHINRSLLALGNCITALSEHNEKGIKTYVNYRDSKLTRLLKEALGGNCKTVMIAHVGPAHFHFEESRNTLLYADRAKRIKNKVRRNVEDVSYHIAQYTQIISELRGEIERLRAKISQSMTQTANIQAVQNEVLRSATDQEFFKMKEQLMMVFKDQIELRRKFMDLTNASMDISIEAGRNTLTLNEWEAEQARIKEKKEHYVDNRDKEMDKQLDMEGLSYDEVEPAEITMAREELKVLNGDKKKVEKKCANIAKELQIAKQKAALLEETLPKYVSTEAQKEILTLLLRIHELEIENIEYQSQCYLRDHELAQKDFIISRYQNYRSLADEIITQQKELMNELLVVAPKELEELYDLYQHEQVLLEDGSGRQFLPVIKATSQMNLIEMSSSTQNLTRLSTLAEESATRFADTISNRKTTLNRSSPDRKEDKVFSLSPKSLPVRDFNGVNNRHLNVSPLKLKQKEDTLYTISMRSNSAESLEKRDILPSQSNELVVVKPAISQETRSIAALAAAKKRRQQQEISRLSVNDSQFNPTFMTSYIEDHHENQLTPSRLASHNMTFISGSKLDFHDDNDSLHTAELHSESTANPRRMDNAPAKGASKVPRLKYRPQPLTNQSRPQPIVRINNDYSGSQSDRQSEKQTEPPTLNVKQTANQKKRSHRTSLVKQSSWRTNGEKQLKPPTNKVTTSYLKHFGSSLAHTKRAPYKSSSEGVSDSKQTAVAADLHGTADHHAVKESKSLHGPSKTKQQLTPSIPSYRKGDMAIAGFSLRH